MRCAEQMSSPSKVIRTGSAANRDYQCSDPKKGGRTIRLRLACWWSGREQSMPLQYSIREHRGSFIVEV
jgi:hypothetical protein